MPALGGLERLPTGFLPKSLGNIETASRFWHAQCMSSCRSAHATVGNREIRCEAEPGKPSVNRVAPHDRSDGLAQPPTSRGILLKSALQVEMQCQLSDITRTKIRSTVLSAFLR